MLDEILDYVKFLRLQVKVKAIPAYYNQNSWHNILERLPVSVLMKFPSRLDLFKGLFSKLFLTKNNSQTALMVYLSLSLFKLFKVPKGSCREFSVVLDYRVHIIH